MNKIGPTLKTSIAEAIALLSHYGFDTGIYTSAELVSQWLERYEANWIRFAVIEALYQGRYKIVSVEQILDRWSRRGYPSYHFNRDFERIIGRKLPNCFTTYTEPLPHSLLMTEIATPQAEEVAKAPELETAIAISEPEPPPTPKAKEPAKIPEKKEKKPEIPLNLPNPAKNALFFPGGIRQFTPAASATNFFRKLLELKNPLKPKILPPAIESEELELGEWELELEED